MMVNCGVRNGDCGMMILDYAEKKNCHDLQVVELDEQT